MQTLERKFDLGIKKFEGDLRSQKILGLFHSLHFFSPTFQSSGPQLSIQPVCVSKKAPLSHSCSSTLPWKAMFLLHRCPLQDVHTVFYSKLSHRYSDLKARKSIKSNPRLHYCHRIMIYCRGFTLTLFYQSAAFAGLFFPLEFLIVHL